MAPNAEDLAKRLAALSERFTTLAAALAQATRELQAGIVPSEAVVDEITKIRTDFVEVRHRILEAARSLSITVPAISEVDSLRALEPVLQTLVQTIATQEKKAALSEARTRVMTVLDRILTVTHSDGPNFASLVQCLIKAKETRQAAQDPKAFDSEDAPAFLNRIPASAVLLSIIEGRDAIDEHKFAVPDEQVTQALVRTLAVAAARGKLAAGAVKEELGKYNYVWSVPIQKSTDYEEGLLSYGYSILLDHIERRFSGFVNKALNSLKTFQPGTAGAPKSVGAHLYNVLVNEGRLQEIYPEFVKTVLLAAVPEPGLWTHARILESTTETRIFTHPSNRIGDPEHNSQRLTQERQRFADHRFPVVVSPITARFFAIAADLREPRSIDVKLVDGRSDSDHAWLLTMPPVGRADLKSEVLRLFPEGTSVPGLGRDYATLWVAVFNPDPSTEKKYELTLSLKQSAATKPSTGTFRSAQSA